MENLRPECGKVSKRAQTRMGDYVGETEPCCLEPDHQPPCYNGWYRFNDGVVPCEHGRDAESCTAASCVQKRKGL